MAKQRPWFDVCIVCALAEEAHAVLSVFERRSKVKFTQAVSPQTHREYRHATITNSAGQPCSIHVSWQTAYGPQEAALHLQPVLEEWRPRLAVMTGICAGDKTRVKLGDLVVAERAFTYDSGKFIRNNTADLIHLHDTDTYHADKTILNTLRLFDAWQPVVNRLPRPRSTRQQRDWLLNRLLEPGTPSVYAIPEAERRKHAPQWEALLRTLQGEPLASLTPAGTLRDSNLVLELRYGTETFPFTDPRRATCYIASMASGSAVRSDNPFQHVREPVRGTMAVEMEGAAFYRTVADFPDVRPLLVKGVCDYADMEKDDTYHRYAAQVSATYVWCFLQQHVTTDQMPRLHTTPARRRSRRSSSAGSASPPPRGPSPEALAALEAHYRQTLIDQFEHLTFKGLSPSGTPIVLPLEQIYVELKAVADVPDAADAYSAEERRQFLEAQGRGPQAQEDMAVQLDALRVERWNRQARQELSQLQRRSIHDTLMDATQRGVVFLGDPGSGKTTLLHYQALRAARGPSSPGATPALLPIFVPLAAYDDYLRQTPTRRPLEEFLPAYYEQWRTMPGLAPLFEKALEAGRALVLLDGLDEVPDTATRQFVAEQAGAFIQHWAARGNRFAVTSRIVGYREARLPGDLPHVTVLDFGRAEMEVFAGQWCQAYETWVAGHPTPTALQQAEHEAQALLREVQSNPSVERLAASPLLLTMLALLRRQVGKLPERRIALYERYVSTLIDNWELVRSAGARQQAPTRFDLYTAQYYLIELALWLQQHKPGGTARRQELLDVLERICLRFEGHDTAPIVPKQQAQAQRTAAQFLQEMRHFAGLLAERGRDAFGFLHLTFQEYFCGRALARLTPEARWQAMQAHLHLPRWREPILLCAGQLGVMEQRRDQADALVQRILSADSPPEDLLHRDLFLAVALATDDVGLSPAVLDAMTARLAPLRASHVPTIRDTALAGLAHLSQLGHGVALDILLTTLQDTRLQYHVMRNAQAMLGAEPCRLLRQAVVAKLDDPDTDVRRAALGALAGLVGSEAALAARFLSWLGTVSELDPWSAERTRRLLAEAFAPLLVRDEALLSQVAAMLRAPAWPVRQGAAWALIAMPGGPPAHLLPTLYGLLEDRRGEEGWPARLAVCALLLNDRGAALSQRAVAVAVEALDYATQPWYHLPDTGPLVRQQAAQVLGQLEPLYRNEVIFARLTCVLHEDSDPKVRDAAYGALLRLAAAPEERA